MEDWSKQLGEFLEATTRITEWWLEYTLDGTLEAADALADEIEYRVGPTLDEWAENFYRGVEPLEDAIDAEAEQAAEELSELIEPVMAPLISSLEIWLEAIATPVNNTVEPLINDHSTCVGCRHYHGQSYGGNLLICAMHPYGPEAESCPDWESVWPQPPDSSNG